ncbi:polyketide synthase regulator [Bifidobacterium callitrichos]|uniref:Polyketide synthase regulator n=1 Tax=Bifidobacterium callitrichos TaxID=762209 RepID=A0A2T3GB97_9BIFI|nr:helix-turn-helix domain-containing protein [Bifidobacterium callitrichos]PST46766.1 polyketide synthase regulator [Bifidobacterium callitrichos]
MADFLDVLTSHVSKSVSEGVADGGDESGAGHSDARALLTRVAFESLADGLSDDRVASMLRVLGWDGDVPCFAIAGWPGVNAAATMQAVNQAVADLGGESPVCGARDGVVAAVIRIEAAVRPEVVCTAVSPAFAGGVGEITGDDAVDGATVSDEKAVASSPLCLGPVRHGVAGAAATLGAALTTLQAAPALTSGSPAGDGTGVTGTRTARPVRGVTLLRAEDALPERALLGDPDARRELVDVVYGSLAGTNPDDPTMLTVSTFLASGGSLETTARTLNVHPNTVRYRLKRAADSTGWDATDPREAYVLTTAIALGRMHAA